MKIKSITRNSRTAFIILIDQSGSMADMVDFCAKKMNKSQVVAKLCNSFLQELLLISTRDNERRHYFDIALVAYSGDGVRSIFGDEKSIFVPVTEIEEYILERKIVDFERELSDNSFRIDREEDCCWVKAKNSGNTPMHEALNFIYYHLQKWCSEFGELAGFVPLVFNITDGIASDCNQDHLGIVFEEIKSIKCGEENPLLFNIHIAPDERAPQQRIFPTVNDIKECECRYLKVLFDGASPMPEEFTRYICTEFNLPKPTSDAPFKGLGYNTTLSSLFTMLNIGSTSLRRG